MSTFQILDPPSSGKTGLWRGKRCGFWI